MKFIIKIILLFFVISTHVNAINFYKYPEESLDKNLCNNIYDKLNNPNLLDLYDGISSVLIVPEAGVEVSSTG